MKVAILGGGNVYALNLARHLSEIGIEHFGIGRSGPKPAPMWQVDHHYRFWALHLVDHLEAYLAILDTERPDVIVNFAAQGEGAASFGADAHLFYRTNLLGLSRLVEELRHRSYLKRFVQIGSSEVYGSVWEPAKDHEAVVLRPSSPYAISKAAFDQHLQVMHRVHGFPMNIIRPSNAYCPGQQLHRIIPRAIICALSGQKLKLQGGGKAEKSYIHGDDLSRAIVTVIERGFMGSTYNCGPKETSSIKSLVELVAFMAGVEPDTFVEIVPARTGEDGKYWLDSSSLQNLGWREVVGLGDGLRGMIEWVRRYPELLTTDTTFRMRA